jgi:hypothetical protein
MPRYGDLADLLSFLPQWLALLLIVVTVSWTVCMAGLALGKVGRNPYWALILFFFPPLLLPGLLWLAVTRWPSPSANRDAVDAIPAPPSQSG